MSLETAISEAVGRRARNRRHDVLVVQMLLNNHIFAIGPRPRLSVDGVCGPRTEEAILAYQQRAVRMTHPDGIIDPASRTLRVLLEVASVKHMQIVREVHRVQKLQVRSQGPVANVDDVAPPPHHRAAAAAAASTPSTASAAQAAAHLYTDSSLEMAKARTPVRPSELANLLQKNWPDLNWNGVLLLVAQYMGETNEKSCWNYNLGNLKCTSAMRMKRLHQYLPGTWEVYTNAKAASEIARDANARYATAAEIKQKVGKEKTGSKVVFYKPPDIQCCFRAYKTLSESVVDWTDFYKHWLKSSPDFVTVLNKCDCEGFGRILVKHGYFTNASAAYISTLKSNWARLQKTLGKP